MFSSWSTTIRVESCLSSSIRRVQFEGQRQDINRNSKRARVSIICGNVLGEPQIATDERFSTNVNRCANRQELDGIIQNVFSQHHVGALVERLEQGNIAFANVSTMKGLSNMLH